MTKTTAQPALSRIHAVNPVGRRIAATGLSEERVRRSVRRVLGENVLCSIATVTQIGRAHINTAYFSFSDELELFFLSHPDSLHCRNLANNPSIGMTVFSSVQKWTDPGRGLQLFGRCNQAKGRHAKAAEQLYGRRFGAYRRWKVPLEAESVGLEYRFYRFVVSSLKILDEREFGDGVFVAATVNRKRHRAA